MGNEKFYRLPVEQLLALTAYGEAGNEGDQGMAAVLNVIRNRTQSWEFIDPAIYNQTGSVYHAVILKPKQFSMYNPDDPVRPIAEQIASNFEVELSRNSKLERAYQLALNMLSGNFPDNTMGATYYHADYVYPIWASVIPLIGKIGRHIFYGWSKNIPEVPTEEAPVYPLPEEESPEEEQGTPTLQASMAPAGIAVLFGLAMAMGLWSLSRRA